VSASMLLCLLPPSKMVRARDRAGKRKATSPTTMPSFEMDVAALRQHVRLAGERMSKAREDKRIVSTSRGRGLQKRASPPAKQSRVIEFTSSEVEAIPACEQSGGASEREQSWRYVSLLPANHTLSWTP
jgi:hypothetical protein